MYLFTTNYLQYWCHIIHILPIARTRLVEMPSGDVHHIRLSPVRHYYVTLRYVTLRYDKGRIAYSTKLTDAASFVYRTKLNVKNRKTREKNDDIINRAVKSN